MVKNDCLEHYWRRNVLPLGIFFILGGSVLPVVALLAPDGYFHFPVFRAILVKRLILFGWGLACLAIGVGICVKLRPALYVMLACFGFGAIAAVVLPLADRDFYEGVPLWFTAVLGFLFNGGFGVGLYFVTRPCLRRGRTGGGDSPP